ncbi:MAG: CHRD domain-containing protein [Nitrososphaeraceae archaeon]
MDIIVMPAQLSTRVTLFLILGLTSLAIVLVTVTYANAQSDGLTGSAAAVSAATMVGTSSSSSTTPVSGKHFSAVLTGDNEVPPVNTDATGKIKLFANPQQSMLNYQISISDLNGVVTGAHIHKGSVGTNGPVVATLKTGNTFAGASASSSGSGGGSTSTSVSGTITTADLKGPLAGKQVTDLIRLIEDGKAYVNVHTHQNSNGEIRGQLKSSST